MKKILAFIVSASMCLSLLTVLTPAFAYEQGAEQTIQTRMVGPEDEDPEKIPFEIQDDNP